MVTLYHNNRCSKSRSAKAMLDDKGVDYQVKSYLEEGLSIDELKQLVKKLNILSIRELMRTKETIYRDLELNSKSEDQLYEALVKHPILLERPIVVKDDNAIIARPPEKIESFLF